MDELIRTMRQLATVAVAFGIAGCGADREPASAPATGLTIVRLTLDPDGSGPQPAPSTVLECPSLRRERAC